MHFERQSGGGIERFTEAVAARWKHEHHVIVITRRFSNSPRHEGTNPQIIRTVWLRGRYLRNPSFNLASLWTFFRAVKRKERAVVVLQGQVASSLSPVIRLFRPRVKSICIPHGEIFSQPHPRLVKAIIRIGMGKGLKAADDIIYLNAREQALYEHRYPSERSKGRIVNPGVDHTKFMIRGRKPNKGRLPITFIGRLVEEKGVRDLLSALPSIKGEVIVAGDGPLERDVRTAARKGWLLYLGRINGVEELLKKTEIFVLPSHGEGFPLALAEAMAAGCAPVITDIGLPLTDGREALVVPTRNSEALAAAVNELIDKPSLRKRIQRNARRYARTRFDWNKTAADIIERAVQNTKR
ncbi:glycosyltransferase family 4 protein [Candidatus Woesearchaeota archaeon]|nr:glycosyltransferase family 4 protein [Candidatus Woesearchaeota archaeon]